MYVVQISVIDHSQIMEESIIPTFNSNTIECNMHRIPGLLENFLYFNDDVFVGQEINWPQDFHT